MKDLITLDLQLFAGETSIDVGGETIEIDPAELSDEDIDLDIELEDEEDGLQIEDEANDDNEETNDSEETNEEEVTKKEPNETAKAAIAERRKWQEKLEKAQDEAKKSNDITSKLMKLVGASNVEELQTKLDLAEAASLAQEQNISPEQAQAQIRERRELDDMRREVRNLKYENEAQKLMTDPFYADLSDYRDDFQQIAERTGLTLEEVYMSKRGKERMKEMEREIEQRVQSNQTKRQKAKVDTTADGTNVKAPKVDLSPELMGAAKLAVSMGHFKNVEEYAQYHKKYGKR